MMKNTVASSRCVVGMGAVEKDHAQQDDCQCGLHCSPSTTEEWSCSYRKICAEKKKTNLFYLSGWKKHWRSKKRILGVAIRTLIKLGCNVLGIEYKNGRKERRQRIGRWCTELSSYISSRTTRVKKARTKDLECPLRKRRRRSDWGEGGWEIFRPANYAQLLVSWGQTRVQSTQVRKENKGRTILHVPRHGTTFTGGGGNPVRRRR